MSKNTNLEFTMNIDLIIEKIKKWTAEMMQKVKKTLKGLSYSILIATCKKLNKMNYLYMAYHHKSKRIRKKYKRKIVKLFYENISLFISKDIYDAYTSV